jgi:hypothetical protein
MLRRYYCTTMGHAVSNYPPRLHRPHRLRSLRSRLCIQSRTHSDRLLRLDCTFMGHPRRCLRDDHARRGAAAWPVEDVLMFPSGSAALSASGPILRAWDLVAGGRCVRAMSNHQKTVTTLAFDGRAGRLLTGGLDQMVKVYDVSTYKVVHTMKYPAPVLSLAISVSIFLQRFNSISPLHHVLASLMIPISQLASPMVLYLFVDGNLRRPKPRRQKQSARPSVRMPTNSLRRVCWGISESATSNRRRRANPPAMSTKSRLRVDERRNYASTTDY